MHIIDFFNQRMIRRNAQFNEFAIFFIIFNIFPYLVWKDNVWVDSYVLKFISGSMCILLFTKELWLLQYKKYFSLYWYLCVFLSLPLMHSMILFQNNFAEWALINFIFSIFILSFLVDWDIFLANLILGLVTTTIYLTIFSTVNILELIYTEIGAWFIYSLTLSASISLVFIKNHEGFYNLSLEKAKQAFGLICHEIKNPLATLQLLNTNYRNQSFATTKDAKTKYLHKTDIIIRDIYYILDDILIKLQANKKLQLQKLYIREQLAVIIRNYPFKEHEKSFINIALDKDFEFAGDSMFFKFLIFNILNNCLFYSTQKKNFKVRVYMQSTIIHNILVIEDNGPGISERDIPLIFNSFYSNKVNGTGLGMFFCKQVMLKFRGDIVCESQLGDYTRFKLIFPCI